MKTFFLTISSTIILSLSLFSQVSDFTIQLTMRDGNVVKGTSKFSTIVLITDYGSLNIPIKNVSTIDIGIASDKATSEKVTLLIKQLANSNEQLRKSVYNELVKMDVKAIPAIKKMIYNPNFESSEYTDYNAESALSELSSQFNVDENINEKDIISIDSDYRMLGLYDFNKIELKTEYGLLNVPKEKIKHIDILYHSGNENEELMLKLNANKHISANTNGGWLTTGLVVKSGQKISIAATGEITFASLSNAKYKADGKIVGENTTQNYEGDYDYGVVGAYPTYGNVVYKIGESSTQILKAGAKYSGVATKSGMIYISIYETVYNAANTGSYNVKVSVK